MSRVTLSRRQFLTASAAGVAATTLVGCDRIDPLLRPGHPVRETMASANGLTLAAQRAAGTGQRVFGERDPPGHAAQWVDRPQQSRIPDVEAEQFFALPAGRGRAGGRAEKLFAL